MFFFTELFNVFFLFVLFAFSQHFDYDSFFCSSISGQDKCLFKYTLCIVLFAFYPMSQTLLKFELHSDSFLVLSVIHQATKKPFRAAWIIDFHLFVCQTMNYDCPRWWIFKWTHADACPLALCCPCSLLSILPWGVRHLWILWQEVHEHLDLLLRRSAHLLRHAQLPHG